MSTSESVAEQHPEQGAPQPGLARSAGVLALGNVGSRVLGLLREVVIAAWFGASGQVSAFRIAAQVPNLVYDLLIGGMLSAALVPVLSQTAQRSRSDFARLVGALLGLFAVVLALLAALLALAAPLISGLLAAGFRDSSPELFALTTRLIRMMAPAIWFFSMAGLLTAVLYALQRFSFPALATAIFNLGVVSVTPLLAGRLGIGAAALGVLLGSAAQLAVMAWDVRRAGVSLRPRWPAHHPALRQILRLYLPIAAGLLVMLFQVGLDRRLASGTGAQSIAWMASATTLQQLPLGLISVAISLAALPSLSRLFGASDEAGFQATLTRGLRLVLMLIAPAAVLLALLAEPATRLLFERGAFTPADTAAVASILLVYLLGMVFAAVDFPLNYAFYARNNTLTPALVGVLSVGVYVAVAFALVGPLGYTGLVWADTAKQAAHALVMVLLTLRLGPREGWVQSLATAGRVGLAAAGMALILAVLDWGMRTTIGAGALADLLRLAAGGALALAAYALLLRVLHVEEVALVWQRFGAARIIRRLKRERR